MKKKLLIFIIIVFIFSLVNADYISQHSWEVVDENMFYIDTLSTKLTWEGNLLEIRDNALVFYSDATVWTEQRPRGDDDWAWYCCSINEDGTKFIAGQDLGKLYTFDGTIWTEQQPAGATTNSWSTCDINADGTKFIAGIKNGRLYSYDGSWTEQQPAGATDQDWRCAINADGTKFIACVWGGRIYSYDSSWTEQRPVGDSDEDWSYCDISDDGTKFIVGEYGGRLWTFDGSTWIEQRPAGDNNKNWYPCAINADGTKFIAATAPGRLYSYDGSSWLEQRPAGDNDKNWLSYSINEDGTKLIAGINSGRLYTFERSSWEEMRPAGDVDVNWYGAINADGTKYIAGYFSGRLFSGSKYPEIFRVNNDGITIDGTINSCTFDVNSNSIIDANGNRTYFGEEAGSDKDHSSGFGYRALYNNTGSYCTAFGSRAFYDNTGTTCTAFGIDAGYGNTVSDCNTVGYESLLNNTGAYSNAFGNGSLRSNAGANSSAFGHNSLYGNQGANSSGFGYEVLISNQGASCSALGYQALKSNTQNNNTAIGALAFTSNTTLNNSTAIGYDAEPDASNQVMLGDTNVTEVKTAGKYIGAGMILPNDTYYQANNYAGSGVVDIIKINQSDNIEFGTPVEMGQFTVPLSSGVATFVNIDADGSSAGAQHGIKVIANGSENLFTVITEDDGAAGIQNTIAKVYGDFEATGQIGGATYGSDGSVLDAELLYINTLGSNAQTQLDARCLESVFGTAISTGLYLDGTDLKTSTGLQSLSGLTLTAGDISIATGANAWNVLDAGATTTVLVGGGAGNPVWTTATGTGAPVRADSPTFTTKITTPEIEVEELLLDTTPDSDHTASGIKGVFTNGNAGSVAFGDVCYIVSDDDLEFADADAAATMPGIYMALGTITAASSGEWLRTGFVRDDTWTWTIGGLIYISCTGTTGNTLIQVAPSGVGDQVQIIGIAITATVIDFNPNLMLIEIAAP